MSTNSISIPASISNSFVQTPGLKQDKETAKLAFFYIGKNFKTLDFLYNSFSKGYVTSSYEEAIRIMRSEKFQEVGADVFFIDLPYKEFDLRLFTKFIATIPNAVKTPVLYNENQIADGQEINADLVDDVIDLNNWQFDFTSKVKFLREIKKYTKPEEPAYRFQPSIKPANNLLKRSFDITVALIALLLLTPLFLLIAIAIRIESKGPIFYNAKRAGRGFKIFSFYKFRTMEVNADQKIQNLAHLNQYDANSNGPKFFKISNDPRITKVGKFLRNTSMDELPQLVNVLKGDMSLVGNRPLPLYEAATLTTNEFVERFMAPAGITGLWQIKKRGREEMSIHERINLDISYARRSNLIYDFWIMANTPKALFQKDNV